MTEILTTIYGILYLITVLVGYFVHDHHEKNHIKNALLIRQLSEESLKCESRESLKCESQESQESQESSENCENCENYDSIKSQTS